MISAMENGRVRCREVIYFDVVEIYSIDVDLKGLSSSFGTFDSHRSGSLTVRMLSTVIIFVRID